MTGLFQNRQIYTNARVTADLLAWGRSLDYFSLVLTILGFLGFFLVSVQAASKIALMVAFLLGGVQKIFALRVMFDQRQFVRWAARWERSESAETDVDFADFDRALAQTGWRSPDKNDQRDLAARMKGAVNFLKKQIIIVIFQFAALLVASGIMYVAVNCGGL